MGVMHVMTRRGDDEVKWDPNNPTEVAQAEKEFDEYQKKGALAFVPEGNEGRQISHFDKTAERIIISPQLAGGSR